MDSWKVLSVTAIFLVLTGCSGGGSGQTAGIDRGGATGGAAGPITGFGSVIVNGLHYETAAAQITVDGRPATEADLEVGYFVAIQADFPSDGTGPNASVIDFNHNVIGQLGAVDTVAGQATVSGQLVTINGSTFFDSAISPASIDGLVSLPAGQILRVSGFVDAASGILATRVGLGAVGSNTEVIGFVENLDTAALRFEIGGLIVDYQSASVEDFPTGSPSEGDRVEVRGSVFGPSGELIAAEVENNPLNLDFGQGDQFEVEGLITQIDSPATFTVSEIPVLTDAQTNYENGNAADVAVNVKVEVEGHFDSGGLLVADTIEFKPDGEIRAEAQAETVNTGSGTVVVLGISFQTNISTSFEDKSPPELRPFSLFDINPGDPLRIIGAESGETSDTVIASRVERTEPLEKLRLRGIAENLMEPNFEILGLTITTDAGTDIEDTFFSTAEGRLVEAEGDVVGGAFLADKVEFKD